MKKDEIKELTQATQTLANAVKLVESILSPKVINAIPTPEVEVIDDPARVYANSKHHNLPKDSADYVSRAGFKSMYDKNMVVEWENSVSESICMGGFIAARIAPNALSTPTVCHFNDNELVSMDTNGNIVPMDTRYPMVIGGYNKPAGVYVPFGVSEDGMRVANQIFDNNHIFDTTQLKCIDCDFDD